MLDVAVFHPFRMDLRALGFSLSCGVVGTAGRGVFARGTSFNRGLAEGRGGDCVS